MGWAAVRVASLKIGGVPKLANLSREIVAGGDFSRAEWILGGAGDMSRISRYVPVPHRRLSCGAEDVGRTLEQFCPNIGYPKTIRADNVLRAERNGADSQSLSVRQRALAA